MNARTFLRALLCAAVFSVAASASAAEEAQAAPLKIGIVGTGNIGGALAKHWAKAGHELVISSRHPEELQSLAKSLGPKVRVGTPLEAAQFGDVILLSVPYKATAASRTQTWRARGRARSCSTPAIPIRCATARWLSMRASAAPV